MVVAGWRGGGRAQTEEEAKVSLSSLASGPLNLYSEAQAMEWFILCVNLARLRCPGVG